MRIQLQRLAQSLQRVLREPSRSDAAVIAEHETQVKPVPEGRKRTSHELWLAMGTSWHTLQQSGGGRGLTH